MSLTEKQREALAVGKAAIAEGKPLIKALRDAGISNPIYYAAKKKLKKHGLRGPRNHTSLRIAAEKAGNTPEAKAAPKAAPKPLRDASKIMVVIGSVDQVKRFVAEGLS